MLAPLIGDVRLHMATTPKTMHVSAAVLFGIAVALYLLGSATEAVVFSAIGMLAELAAWITVFKNESRSDKTK